MWNVRCRTIGEIQKKYKKEKEKEEDVDNLRLTQKLKGIAQILYAYRNYKNYSFSKNLLLINERPTYTRTKGHSSKKKRQRASEVENWMIRNV